MVDPIDIPDRHRFITYARPFHVWMNGAAVFLTVAAVLIAFFLYPERVNDLIKLVESITAALAASNVVAGIYIWRRSDDKKTAAGG